MEKNLEYYANLPYRIVFYPSPEGGYAVEIPDLPGCLTQGETLEEAKEMIEEAKRCWIAAALEDGMTIPEPTPEEYSGKLNIRIPKSLHRTLAEKAKEEGTSLNQLIVYHLSRGIGRKA